jgi:hypothetical protein
MRSRTFIATLIGGVLLSGCASPEARRTRGGGPGADIGNRSSVVKMHEGSEPFWKTPDRIGVDHPTLEPARQAQQLSRR